MPRRSLPSRARALGPAVALAVVAGLGLGLGGVEPARAQEPPTGADAAAPCGTAFPSYTRAPVGAGSTLLSDVAIPMSDGVVLRADVRLPAGLPGPFPAALTITGYTKTGVAAAFGTGGGGLADHGYAVVTVDDRGTGASGGAWDSWGPRTLADYPEVLDWIVAQPWSDGTIGVTGASYMGITSLFAAATEHPAVRAVFATVPMADAYRDIVFAGGQINAAFIPLWMGLVTGLGLLPSGSDPTVIVDHLLGVTQFQLPTVADAVVGGGTAFDGPFWRQRSPIEVVDRIEVPTFIVGGLDDLFQRGEPMLYERLADNADSRLLIGPWSHLSGATGAGLPRDGVPTVGALLLQWFDEHVMGLDTGAACIPPVTQYIRGAERYESAPTWPVPDLHAERWHLRGDGTLTEATPGAGEPGRDYLQLPITGMCSRSANQWLAGALESTPCNSDNRLDEALSLTYTTAPFTEAVRINGPMQADLWLSAALGTDAVTAVAVSDVAPDGTSRGLTNGLVLASNRAVDPALSRTLDGQSIQPWHPFTAAAAEPLVPGEPVLVPIEVFPTSAEIPAGHRLRVTIAAYDVPHALPPAPAALSTLAGPVTVLNDDAHPSSVVLPVVGARSSTTAAAAGIDAARAAAATDAAATADAGAAAAGTLPTTGGGLPVVAPVAVAALALALTRLTRRTAPTHR